MNSSFIVELLRLLIFPPNFCIFIFGTFMVVLFDMLNWLSLFHFLLLIFQFRVG